jgi:hypothetical protein
MTEKIKTAVPDEDRDEKFNYTSSAGLSVDNSEAEGEPFDFSAFLDDEEENDLAE